MPETFSSVALNVGVPLALVFVIQRSAAPCPAAALWLAARITPLLVRFAEDPGPGTGPVQRRLASILWSSWGVLARFRACAHRGARGRGGLVSPLWPGHN